MTETSEALRVLDPDVLMQAASQEIGLTDYGDERFVEPLRRYCSSLIHEARLTSEGIASMRFQLVGFLTNRLQLQADLLRHPEILDEVVVRPVVIVGLPRTGTTKLQRMMSQNPDVQSMTFWRTVLPAPFADWKPGDPDPRVQVGEVLAAGFREQAPELAMAHYTDAHEADEEARLQMLSFEYIGNAIWLQSVPSYRSWLMARSPEYAYDYLHLLLKYLQWQDQGGRGRPWILKSPFHLGHFDELTKQFPDATVVHTHRDPAVVLASWVRIWEIVWGMTTAEVDLTGLGQFWLTYLSGEMAKGMAQRTQIGDGVTFLDVPYEAIRDDTLTVIREIHQRRGETLAAAAEEQMQRWSDENPQHRHGAHEYSLERYGLTRSDVEAAFASYLGHVRDLLPEVEVGS